MKVREIRSDKVYNKILCAKEDKKDDIYRYELMDEFSYKWSYYNIPIKAKQKGGYDVIMASSMLGYMAPTEIDESKSQEVKYLNNNEIWNLCTKSIEDSLEAFINSGVELKINEGLAENFATWMYGEEMLGPWVTKTDMETLNDYIKPIIKEALNVQGLDGITAYLYGDDIAEAQGYFKEGLPFCAGYACGYHMIKYYLKKTGKSIIEATLLPYEEIKKELLGFWEC